MHCLKAARRRPILLFTSFMMWTSALTIAVLGASSSGNAYVILALLFVSVAGFGGGVGVICWLLLGELCPVKVRGITAGIGVIFGYLGNFVAFNVMNCFLGNFTQAFWIFFAFQVCFTAVVFWCLPETKGLNATQLSSMTNKTMESS